MDMTLQEHIEQVNNICARIENDEEYMGDLTGYLPALNQMMQKILEVVQNSEIPFDINEQFVLQVLEDIVYGIEHSDAVILLDVLRYGLLEIYYYIADEWQGGVLDE